MGMTAVGRARMRRWTCAAIVLAAAGLLAQHSTTAPAAGYDWLQFDGNAQHSGDNVLETTISPLNVAGLQRLYRVPLPSTADDAPVYLSGVATASGARDLVFVTTTDGHIIALDAHTGLRVWARQNPAGSCTIAGGSQPCFTTSSPAIDPKRQYVYSYGLDGFVHKYRVGDGTEIRGGGWPELATRKPGVEKGSSALNIATVSNGASYLYVANAGYPGDPGDYQGHLTAINLATGAQRVFDANCSDQAVHFVAAPGSPDCPQVRSGIWARSGVVYDAATGRIYMATGNGPFAPTGHDWGDSVLALNPDGTGVSGGPLDSYTPANYQFLEHYDVDLGSTAPAILPTPSNSSVRHLAVQSGKDSLLRLLDLDNLSGQGGPGHIGGTIGPSIAVPQGGAVLTTPAVWINARDGSTWLFITSDNGIAGLRLAVSSSGMPSLQPLWQRSGAGTSPLVANGVLYDVGNHTIQALDPTNGHQLWHDTSIGGIHWESPIVANGVVYVADGNNTLTAYGLK